MVTSYMAIALGRGDLRERVYGALVPYEFGEEIETRPFEERSSKGIIDILYKGPDKAYAKKQIAHLLGIDGLLELLFGKEQ